LCPTPAAWYQGRPGQLAVGWTDGWTAPMRVCVPCCVQAALRVGLCLD
jgi:hypothetical protein